jgi:hypothetical protein
LWHLLAENARLAGDLATAERAVDRAIALAPGATQEDRAAERLLRANVVAERDPREAARELVRAFAIDADPTLVRRYWLNHEREATVEKLAAAADEVGVDAATRAALLAAHPAAGAGAGSGTSAGATVAAGDPGVAAVLTRHLVAMVEECRAAGAEPFLVSYPYRVADVDAAREAAARETGAARVELVARFDELLRELPREALFVPDGHCNDRGYAEIAALVAAALQRPR